MKDNRELLLACVQSGDFSDAEALDARITVTPGEAYVDFACGGRGLSVSGCDYGFYYSKDDVPLACYSWVNDDGALQVQGMAGTIKRRAAATATIPKGSVLVFITTNQPFKYDNTVQVRKDLHGFVFCKKIVKLHLTTVYPLCIIVYMYTKEM